MTSQLRSEPESTGDLHYRAKRRLRDEMVAADGSVQPEWQRLMDGLQRLGSHELEMRRDEGRRLLRETGLSFTSLAEGPQWELDPVPYLLTSSDWQQIESGLCQRARLLDLILRDLYGPRTLIASGLLPASLVFRHHGFQRACDQSLIGDPALLQYAADIGRGPDGRMRVVSDRTESGSGAGYALEARIVCSRIMPQLIRQSRVRRLAGYFDLVRSTLFTRAPNQKADPRVVVLSRGDDETAYFDHAYLASYLGYPLVRGEDLTVREGHLWLKSIEGLKLVDIVVRRLVDQACDPLELDAASLNGVPGLLEATRRGNVVVANPLGASVLENSGLLAFLPDIARDLLGEELLLDSARTWWCGRADDREFVLGNLDRLVIKGINRSDGVAFGPALSFFELARLGEAIRREPELFVGQENMGYATTPGLRDGALLPHYALTRCFVSSSHDGYQVLPGGFTRVAYDSNLTDGVTAARGGICKDTWVLADETKADDFALVDPRRTPEVGTAAVESLPSRAAESLYWVGRYAERAESLARLMRTLLKLSNEARDNDPAEAASIEMLASGLCQMSGYEPDRSADLQTLLAAQLNDNERPATVAGAIRKLEDFVSSVRERWSSDTWRIIDDLLEDLELQQSYAADSIRLLETTLDKLITGLSALTGLSMESMTQGDGWRFLVIGRRVERSFWLVDLLRSCLCEARVGRIEDGILEALLIANESLMTHRLRYRANLSVANVLQLIVSDASNPRALAFQLDQVSGALEKLPRQRGPRPISGEERAILQASTQVRLADPGDLSAADDSGQRTALQAFVEQIRASLKALDRGLSHSYFIHVQPARQLQALATKDEE